MENKEALRLLIETLTSSDGYEGDYGFLAADTVAALNSVDESDRRQVPVDYLEFLTAFDYGDCLKRLLLKAEGKSPS